MADKNRRRSAPTTPRSGGASDRREPTLDVRKARRAEAKQQREALRRRAARRRRLRWIALAVAVLAVIGGVTAYVVLRSPPLPGLLTSTPPWPANSVDLAQRLQKIGLPQLTIEGEAVHIHQHLDINVNGVGEKVPQGIGIHQSPNFLSAIHTHTSDGVVHVESPTKRVFTLGQFFDVWGLRFDEKCLGAYCAQSNAFLEVYVNGKIVQGDPREVILAEHQEIFVFFGNPNRLPTTIPSTYTFPSGE